MLGSSHHSALQDFAVRRAKQNTCAMLEFAFGFDLYDIQRKIDRIIQVEPRVLLSIHRESSKSTIIETYCFTKLVSDVEKHFILYIGASEDAAIEHVASIRGLVENEYLPSGVKNPFVRYKPKKGDKKREWKRTSFSLVNGNTIRAIGMDTEILGTKKGTLRPTIIVIDDPVLKERGKDEQTLEWLRSTIFPLGGPNTIIIVIGTPRRDTDVIMELLNDNESSFVRFNFPVYDEDKNVLIPEFWKRRGRCCNIKMFYCYEYNRDQKEERRAAHIRALEEGLYEDEEYARIGVMLRKAKRRRDWKTLSGEYRCCEQRPRYTCWIAKDNSDDLMWKHIEQKKREVKTVAWETEYMCRPIVSGRSLFPRRITEVALDSSWSFEASRRLAHSINQSYINGGEVPERIQCVIGCDLAVSGEEDADWLVYTVLQYSPVVRILDVYRAKGVTYKQQKIELLRLYSIYRPQLIYVESNQYQAVMAQELRGDFAMLPVYPFRTGARTKGGMTNKSDWKTGIPSLRDLFEYDNVKFPVGDDESRSMMNILIRELSGFAYVKGVLKSTTRHDDMVLSFWIAVEAARNCIGNVLSDYMTTMQVQ